MTLEVCNENQLNKPPVNGDAAKTESSPTAATTTVQSAPAAVAATSSAQAVQSAPESPGSPLTESAVQESEQTASDVPESEQPVSEEPVSEEPVSEEPVSEESMPDGTDTEASAAASSDSASSDTDASDTDALDAESQDDEALNDEAQDDEATDSEVSAPGLPVADVIAAVSDDQLMLNGVQLRLPLEGRHNARNLLLAAAVAEEFGVGTGQLQGMQVSMRGGRNRRIQLGGLTVLDETYNASPEAVLAALELLAAQPGRRFAVLGTMLELGDRSLELHRQVAARAADLGLDGLIVVADGAEGEVMQQAAASLPNLARVRLPDQAAAPLAEWLAPGDVLLLKASRGVALERLLPLLPVL